MTDAKRMDAEKVDVTAPGTENEPRVDDRADDGIERGRLDRDPTDMDTERTGPMSGTTMDDDPDGPRGPRHELAEPRSGSRSGSDSDGLRTGRTGDTATGAADTGTGGMDDTRTDPTDTRTGRMGRTGSTRADTTTSTTTSTTTDPLAAPGATGAPAAAMAGSAGTSTAGTPAAGGPGSKGAGLVAADDVERYRNDWRGVQSGFVDDPAGAVREADELVGRLFDAITSRISEQRSALSAQRPEDSSGHTEQLRMALREYRAMFEQLLPTQGA